MSNRDWLLAQHIAYTTEGIGATKRRTSIPYILRTIAIFVLAIAIGIAAVR